MFKKFKSQQEAQAFIEGQPQAKKQRFDKTKVNFSAAIEQKILLKSATQTNSQKTETFESDSDDEIFMSLEEYPDKATTSKKALKSTSTKTATKSKASTNEHKRKDPRSIKYEEPEPTTATFYGGFEFQQDSKGFVHVYTDGSCESNGKWAAAAGLGVYYGEKHPLNVSEPVTGRPTNNAGEIQAAIRAIKDSKKYDIKRLNILTDSQFLINSVCIWMTSWKRKDWRLATGKKVVNEKDFRELDQLIESGNMLIKWSYVPAHSGHHGNEEADRLAKIGASLNRRKGAKDSDNDVDEDLFL